MEWSGSSLSELVCVSVHVCVCSASDGEYSNVTIGALPFVHLVVDCFGLANPTNGQVSLNMTTFGEVANYSCNEGYVLMGPSAQTCQSSGNWTENAPLCQSKLP